jgi:hypothetical protein
MEALHARLSPVRDWNGLRALRQQIEQRLAALPSDLRRDLAMVGAELAENGLRHGDVGAEGEGVEVELACSRSFVELCVTTPLRAAERARAVLERVREIEQSQDKERAYVEQLVALSRRLEHSTSELGFHRIAAEARCSLRAAHQDEQLIICARRAL